MPEPVNSLRPASENFLWRAFPPSYSSLSLGHGWVPDSQGLETQVAGGRRLFCHCAAPAVCAANESSREYSTASPGSVAACAAVHPDSAGSVQALQPAVSLGATAPGPSPAPGASTPA